MAQKVRKGVSFEEDVYRAVKLLAEREGKTVSEIVNSAIKSFLDNSEHSEMIRNIVEHLYLSELYKMAGEIAGRKLALKILTNLEEQVKSALREATMNLEISRLKSKLMVIYRLLDERGLEYEHVLSNAGHVVDDLKRDFDELGLVFDLEEFAEECWLKDIPIETWIKSKLSNVDPAKVFEAVVNV